MKPRWFFLLVLVVFLAPEARAQNNFVYTNNDTIPNSVTGFAVGQDGTLTEVPGSPFLTGGNGAVESDFLFYASNRIRVVGSLLYASNFRSRNVSGFVIDPDTGTLTPVPGSPFPTGGLFGNISLAGSPDGGFLYAASDGSQNIATFGIGAEGELTRIGDLVHAGSEVNGMVVSPDGKWLAVALTFEGPQGSLAMYSIDPGTGQLSPVAGSPFPLEGGPPERVAAGVDINCASDRLFVGDGAFTTTVDVLSIDPDTGMLAPIEGSPFTPGVGINSNVPLLSPDDSLLFVSNQGDANTAGDTVTVFSVAGDGNLTLVPDSPFSIDRQGGRAAGMATDPQGQFLYVTKNFTTEAFPDRVGAFNVAQDGTLTPIPGSPFRTGVHGELLSLAAFPAKTCSSPAK